MGFYGNITNMTRTQFQFDKVYSSRKQMDSQAGLDGVFAGRFVLVNYEDYSPIIDGDQNVSMDSYIQAFKKTQTIYDADNQPIEQVVCLGPSQNGEEILRFKYVQGNGETDDTNALEEGQVVIVPADGIHNLDNPNATKAEWWQVIGQEEESHNALFSPGDDLYSLHYNEDVATYGTSRGYDSTVWQKVYQNGVDRYVMVAELNTITPIFDIEPEAPKMIPLTPHFGADSTNIYYKLHWPAHWGLRVKAASPNLTGPVLNEDGSPKVETETKMSSDPQTYYSDETVRWKNTSYNKDTGESQDYVFIHKGVDKGQWTTMINTTANAMSTPAAIYYNKDGFDPKETSYGYEEVSFNEAGDGYVPYGYYIKENGKYKVATNLAYDARKAPYYKKIEDHIQLQPTGFSGKQYETHDGTGEVSTQEDIQELSIMLPAIGNTIAAVWDLVYGGENVNDGPVRNTDIGWEVARANLDRRGLRLITDYDFNGHYLYQTKNIDTIAGAINSVHDLMGMIITSAYHDDLEDNLNALDINRIYYDKDLHTFNRKRKTYDYTEVDEDIYEYQQINTSEDWNEWAPGVYFVEDNGSYIPDTESFDSTKTYYARKFKQTIPNPENPEEEIPAGVEYEEKDSSTMEIFDGTVYAYKDYLGADSRDYTVEILSGICEEYTEVELTEEEWQSGVYYIYNSETGEYVRDDSEEYVVSTEENPRIYYRRETNPDKIYEPHKFYIKIGDEYELDDSEHVRENITYYMKIYNNDPLMADYVRDSQYNKKKVYYEWDDITISSPIELSGAYEPNEYYIKDNQGNYVLDQNETPSSDKHYYQLKRSNILTVRQAINSVLNNIGVYVPGKYLYEYADGKFKIDNEYTKQGTTYYLVSTETEIDQRATNVYIKRVEYEMVSVTEDKYISGIYWIKENNEFILDTSGVFNPNQDSNNGGHPYYIKQEYLDKISEEYYIIDDSDANKVALIQFHEDEFFIEDNYGNFMVINTIEDMMRHNNDLDHVYVLRNTTNRSSGESNAGTYILNESDFDNPNVSALIKQTTFYEPGKYHYETTDSEGYTDYILDFYPQKTEGREYFHITAVGNPVEKDFFEGYEYYQYNETTNEYELITDSSQLPTGTIYQKVGYYVLNDDAHIYSKGMPWSFDIGYIPASVTLATREEHWGLEPFEDFARNINTMHGMLLKTKAMLDYENEDSRDIRTVQGALNLLGDKIAHFGTWSPDQLILVDKFGRLNGAKIVDSDWLSVKTGYDSEDGKPTIKFINEQNAKYTWDGGELTFQDMAQVFSGENKKLAGNIEYQYADEYSYEEEVEDPYATQRAAFWEQYNEFITLFEETDKGIYITDNTAITVDQNTSYSLLYFGDITNEYFEVWQNDTQLYSNETMANITAGLEPEYYYYLKTYTLDDLYEDHFIPYLIENNIVTGMTASQIETELFQKGENWTPDPVTVVVPAESITYEEVVDQVNLITPLKNQVQYLDENFLFLLDYLGLDIKESSFTIPSTAVTQTDIGYTGIKSIASVTDADGIVWNIENIYGDTSYKNLVNNVYSVTDDASFSFMGKFPSTVKQHFTINNEDLIKFIIRGTVKSSSFSKTIDWYYGRGKSNNTLATREFKDNYGNIVTATVIYSITSAGSLLLNLRLTNTHVADSTHIESLRSSIQLKNCKLYELRYVAHASSLKISTDTEKNIKILDITPDRSWTTKEIKSWTGTGVSNITKYTYNVRYLEINT